MRLPRALGLVGLALVLAHGCAKRGPLVAFLGDSLTSGWKLPESQAYPAQLQRALRQQGRPIRVINAGVSGDTVAQGLKRLPALLRRRPDVLVVALGINDGLRGLPPETTEGGLRQILTLAQAARVCVLLCGFRIPPRFGEEHARGGMRSEEHTSELQSRVDLVCRLLLEKKKKNKLHLHLIKNKKTI